MKHNNNSLKISDFEDKTLLIVDDDDPFRGRLGRAMTSKGFEVTLAKGVEEAKLMAKKNLQLLLLSTFDFWMAMDWM